VNSLILAEHDSPPLNQTAWDWATGHPPLSMTPFSVGWHNFCLWSCSGSYSLPCCVQPGYVRTCLGMGRARTGYRGRCRPPIAPTRIFR